MASLIQLGNVQLLPVKEAAEFVPYSRDYVARLARAGKVVATQIDRQWFVDVISLQNFFAHATLEESVRKRHLSAFRKRDLEVRDVYRARLAAIAEKRNAVHRATFVQTGFILLCGVCAGFVFISIDHSRTPDYVLSVVETMMHGRSSSAAVVTSGTDADMLPGVNNPVVESDTSFDVSRGIVVLPSASSSSSTVEDFFSDPVTVEMTSTTSGNIRSTVSNVAVPFVRVPEGAVVVSQKNRGNTETP